RDLCAHRRQRTRAAACVAARRQGRPRQRAGLRARAAKPLTQPSPSGERSSLRSPIMPAASSSPPEVAFAGFLKLDVRVGTIVAAEPLAGARKPALRLAIDFGPDLGIKSSSAQITAHYTPQALVGRQVAAVLNFPPRQIGKMLSQVLTLGFPD